MPHAFHIGIIPAPWHIHSTCWLLVPWNSVLLRMQTQYSQLCWCWACSAHFRIAKFHAAISRRHHNYMCLAGTLPLNCWLHANRAAAFVFYVNAINIERFANLSTRDFAENSLRFFRRYCFELCIITVLASSVAELTSFKSEHTMSRIH